MGFHVFHAIAQPAARDGNVRGILLDDREVTLRQEFLEDQDRPWEQPAAYIDRLRRFIEIE